MHAVLEEKHLKTDFVRSLMLKMEFKEHELKPVEITTKIETVEHNLRVRTSIKCDVCCGKSKDGTDCVHCTTSVSNEELDNTSSDYYLQAIKSSEDDVNCKLEGTDCSLENTSCTSPQDQECSTVDHIDAKVSVKQEIYEDIPEYVTVDTNFLDVKLENIKEEPTDSEHGLNSNVLLDQNEGSNVEVEQGSLEESAEDYGAKICVNGIEESVFECEVCHMRFSTEPSLRNHEKIHTGESPYTCKVCSKSFPGNHRLKLHSYIHSEDKPFKCDLCPKSFIVKRRLVQHKLLHTEETPYSCEKCSKRFKNEDGFYNHYRTHIEREKKHKCTLCPKSFVDPRLLLNHLSTHK